MSYKLVINGDTEAWGCLAGVTDAFKHDDADDMVLKMYSSPTLTYYDGVRDVKDGFYSGCSVCATTERVKAAVKLVGTVLPHTIWGSVHDKDRALDTGDIFITRDETPASVHAKVSPFRHFIEQTFSLLYFEQAHKYDVLGAFIACHCMCSGLGFTPENQKWMQVSGWHQSVFCGLNFDTEGVLQPHAIRRIAVLYPHLHHLLDTPLYVEYDEDDEDIDEMDEYDTEDRMDDTYVARAFSDALNLKVQKALAKVEMFKSKYPMDMESQVKYARLWHDTILEVLEQQV